jgi:hypothetical protein
MEIFKILTLIAILALSGYAGKPWSRRAHVHGLMPSDHCQANRQCWESVRLRTIICFAILARSAMTLATSGLAGRGA